MTINPTIMAFDAATLPELYRGLDAAIAAETDPNVILVLQATRAIVPPFLDWIDPLMQSGQIDNGQALHALGLATSTLVSTFIKNYAPATVQPVLAASITHYISAVVNAAHAPQRKKGKTN